MSDHGQLADEHEQTADRLEQESERIARSTEDARSKLDSARSDSMIPESLGREDPSYREPSKAERVEERQEQEAKEAEPDTIGESIDQRLSDAGLGQGGERGEREDTDSDKTPGGGDLDDVPDKGGDSED